MKEIARDVLVTTYGVILAVVVQELVDYQKKKTPKARGKHFKRS